MRHFLEVVLTLTPTLSWMDIVMISKSQDENDCSFIFMHIWNIFCDLLIMCLANLKLENSVFKLYLSGATPKSWIILFQASFEVERNANYLLLHLSQSKQKNSKLWATWEPNCTSLCSSAAILYCWCCCRFISLIGLLLQQSAEPAVSVHSIPDTGDWRGGDVNMKTRSGYTTANWPNTQFAQTNKHFFSTFRVHYFPSTNPF